MNKREANEILEDILKWQRLQGIKILRELVPILLNDEKKKIVYEMTDGKNSQSEISKKVGIATGSVSNWWNLWYSNGILIKDGVKYLKIMSLKEIGIEIPELVSNQNEQSATEISKEIPEVGK